jgi:hypothetical protein
MGPRQVPGLNGRAGSEQPCFSRLLHPHDCDLAPPTRGAASCEKFVLTPAQDADNWNRLFFRVQVSP